VSYKHEWSENVCTSVRLAPSVYSSPHFDIILYLIIMAVGPDHQEKTFLYSQSHRNSVFHIEGSHWPTPTGAGLLGLCSRSLGKWAPTGPPNLHCKKPSKFELIENIDYGRNFEALTLTTSRIWFLFIGLFNDAFPTSYFMQRRMWKWYWTKSWEWH
jgi:hypothetical protein